MLSMCKMCLVPRPLEKDVEEKVELMKLKKDGNNAFIWKTSRRDVEEEWKTLTGQTGPRRKKF